MKFNGLLFIISALGIAHQQLHAEQIFDAAAYCPTVQFGLFYACAKLPEEKQISLVPDKVTDTKVDLLNTLLVTNKVKYKFECKTSQQFNVGLKFDDQSHAFFWNQASDIRSTYKLSDQAQKTYSLIFQPASTSTPIWPGCVVNITANESIPDVDMLRTIVDLLKANYTELNELNTEIEKAAELPAKWVTIAGAPEKIDGVVASIENEIAIFSQELEALKSADPATLSSDNKARVEELAGIVELYKSMVNDLKLLKTDLDDLAIIASQCEENVNDAFCLDQVSKISIAINAKAELKRSDLVQLNTFLTAESDRLKTTSVSISIALKRLVYKF